MKKNNNPYMSLLGEWKVFIALILIGILVALGLAEKSSSHNYKSESVVIVEQQFGDQREKRDYYTEENKKLLTSYPVIMTSEDTLMKSAKNIDYKISYEELKKDVTAEVIPETSCIKLTVNASTPETAYRLSNEILKESSETAKRFWKNSNQDVVEEPNEMVEKSPISKTSILKKGLVIGVMLFIIYILYIKVIDDRIRKKGDLEDRFEQPIIGVIKKVSKDPASDENMAAYKNIVENVAYSIPETNEDCKCIGLTDFGYSGKKEENTLMLANEFGKTFKNVLLIDCNFEGDSVTSIISNNTVNGLSEYLTKRLAAEELIGINEELFDFLPAGGRSPHAYKLLDTGKMRIFIENMKRSYDIILLNLPSINTVSEEAFVEELCDGYVVSVEKRKDSYTTIANILNNREGIKDNMIGFIFNE